MFLMTSASVGVRVLVVFRESACADSVGVRKDCVEFILVIELHSDKNKVIRSKKINFF